MPWGGRNPTNDPRQRAAAFAIHAEARRLIVVAVASTVVGDDDHMLVVAECCLTRSRLARAYFAVDYLCDGVRRYRAGWRHRAFPRYRSAAVPHRAPGVPALDSSRVLDARRHFARVHELDVELVQRIFDATHGDRAALDR